MKRKILLPLSSPGVGACPGSGFPRCRREEAFGEHFDLRRAAASRLRAAGSGGTWAFRLAGRDRRTPRSRDPAS
ncbi:hypothetical protein [Candidatus Methylacidiphilum fumarolicum]|uniref:hypothetical protein n=1 Tax=Candidatus Methylacidiphilum fumarolicum TaxID=591154 RepID=UPI0024B85460|nr:hypothetical protein [Candidatus Methylacidiphilum fumarolicum]